MSITKLNNQLKISKLEDIRIRINKLIDELEQLQDPEDGEDAKRMQHSIINSLYCKANSKDRHSDSLLSWKRFLAKKVRVANS